MLPELKKAKLVTDIYLWGIILLFKGAFKNKLKAKGGYRKKTANNKKAGPAQLLSLKK